MSITKADWFGDAEWTADYEALLWAGLKADGDFAKMMGKGTWRTFDEHLLQSEHILPSMCPFTGLYHAGITLGRLLCDTLDNESITHGVRLAQATDRKADIMRHLLLFRAALYGAWSTIQAARGSSLGHIRFENVTLYRYPGPDDRPRPIWVADLNLVAWFPAP